MEGNILIIEDDLDLARIARLSLETHGFSVETSDNGRLGCERALAGEHDLVVLDLNLPEMEGLEICRRMRALACETPILMLSARVDEVDRVIGLELGADDYVTKPVSPRELAARVKAILRRFRAAAQAPVSETLVMEHGELRIDPVRRIVERGRRQLDLTAKEFDLLAHFAAHPGRVFTRADLVEALWGPGYHGYEHTVNSHINRLRRKINGRDARQHFIQTVWGVGYRFAECG